MWEAIEMVLTSQAAPYVLLTLLMIIIIIAGLIKHGYIRIESKAMTVTTEDRERAIIRQQTEWVKVHLEGLEKSMPKPDDYNPWRGKYVVEAVYDEYVKMITYNHLTTNSAYVDVKSDVIVSLVHSLTEKPEFHSKEFEDFLREDTKNSIAKLVQIREVYK